MTRPSRTMADTRRRRASTGRMMDEIMELARSLPLTRQVLADSLETATPAQMEFMLSWMNEELASRERSKRARLLKQAGLPGVKELDGYDWTPVRFPVDYGREALESLDFVANSEDVVLFGPLITLGISTSFGLFLQAFKEGKAVYDPGDKATLTNGKWTPHARSQFRINLNDVAAIYGEVREVDMRDPESY